MCCSCFCLGVMSCIPHNSTLAACLGWAVSLYRRGAIGLTRLKSGSLKHVLTMKLTKCPGSVSEAIYLGVRENASSNPHKLYMGEKNPSIFRSNYHHEKLMW